MAALLLPGSMLTDHGFAEVGVAFHQVSGHNLVIAEMDLPSDGEATDFWAKDIRLNMADGTMVIHEMQRIMHVSPCETAPSFVYVFTYSASSRNRGIIYIHRVSKAAMESVWNPVKERERAEQRRILVGITPKFSERADMVSLTNEVNAPCERCKVFVEHTVDWVTREHPLCAACALDIRKQSTH
jgi:hypothetical protein